jgi:hypothetical protein
MTMPSLPFRDGDRDVADHVAELLKPIETYRLTYDQAMVAANNRLLQAEVDRRSAELIKEHFRQYFKR